MYWNLWNALHLALSRVKVLHFQILTQNQRLFQKSFFELKRSRQKLILKISPWGFMNIKLQFYSKLQLKTQLYFLCLSVPLQCAALYIRSIWGEFRMKNILCLLLFYLIFIFVLFFIIKFVFLSLSFIFFDGVSNFLNKTITNQKLLVELTDFLKN